mgnify:CR=1 FL=1
MRLGKPANLFNGFAYMIFQITLISTMLLIYAPKLAAKAATDPEANTFSAAVIPLRS